MTRYLSWHKIFKIRPASRCFIDCVHDWLRSAWHSSKLDALRSLAQSVSDGANTLTEPAVVAVRVVGAANEAQVTSAEGVRRTERTRPVVAVLTHAVRISTEAPASSREEDTVAVRTGNLITFMTALGCPCPRAFITEFFKLSNRWHAPRTAPVLTGGVVTTAWGDTCLTANLVGAPTFALVIKAVKAGLPVVIILSSGLTPGIVATIVARAACAHVLRRPLHAQAKVNPVITIERAGCRSRFSRWLCWL